MHKEEVEGSNDEKLETNRENLISSAEYLIDILHEQTEFGYTEFLGKFMESNTKNSTLLHESQQRKRQRTTPKIWYIYIHSITLYNR